MPSIVVPIDKNRFLVKVKATGVQDLSMTLHDVNIMQSQMFTGLIDTGANRSCVTEEVAYKIGARKPISSETVKTAGHPTLCALYRIALSIFKTSVDIDKKSRRPKIITGGMTFMGTLAALPKQETEREYDFLIGMDILQLYNIQYSKKNRDLTISW